MRKGGRKGKEGGRGKEGEREGGRGKEGEGGRKGGREGGGRDYKCNLILDLQTYLLFTGHFLVRLEILAVALDVCFMKLAVK